jgi:hypothetical protein
MTLQARLPTLFPSLSKKPVVPMRSWWCRRGLHKLRRWGDDFDRIEICKKCGVVYKVHEYYGIGGLGDARIYDLLGYINPVELEKIGKTLFTKEPDQPDQETRLY